MTLRKTDNLLRGDRTPAYVGRETGAAELQISPDTWDQWVKEGRLPPPCDTFPVRTPRWRWKDVDRRLFAEAEEGTFMSIEEQIALGQRMAKSATQKSPSKMKIGRPRKVTYAGARS